MDDTRGTNTRETRVSDRSRTGAYGVGRFLTTLALIATPVALTIFLFNEDHALNPAWHPHARFHGAMLAWFGITMSLLGLWLLWRNSGERKVGALAAAAIVFLLWSGEIFASFIPRTGLTPDLANPNSVGLPLGIEIHGNILFTGLMIILSVVGGGLMSRSPRTPGRS